MSTANILSIEPLEMAEVPIAAAVTFQTRVGTRTYLYVGPAAIAILYGDDPAHWAGTLIAKAE